MALFEFELARVEDITPWGDPGEQSLSWFALTDGFFWIVVGDQVLFRYTPQILSHWDVRDQDAGYQIAAFVREILGSVAAGVAPLPMFFQRLAADWDVLTRLRDAPLETHPSESAEEMRYTAWRWLGERSPCASYLVARPDFSFVRIGDELLIHWDNRATNIDGIPVWTAQYGVHAVPIASFLAECRDFADRLLAEMAARISNIEAGTARPQIAVDVPSLREQHETWRAELASYFKEYEPDIPWNESEAAIRAIAKHLGVPLPT